MSARSYRVLTAQVEYDVRSRTHLALDKETPCERSVIPPATGRIVAIPEVGGLHHRYDRIAAWSSSASIKAVGCSIRPLNRSVLP
jgi:hypothetical protein